jgi:ferrochelatase
MKLAVVLFNLGGPDSLRTVQPFLRNLFDDPAIIALPGFFRHPLAWFIAKRRAPVALKIYEKIGGRSPIVPETEAQARALEKLLEAEGHEVRCFLSMRYWHPFAEETALAVKIWDPEQIVLLPLYPHFSTTTTQSSRKSWVKAAGDAGLNMPMAEICCYPDVPGFISAASALLRAALARRKPGIEYRVLFSAHGLPERIVEKGDPYPFQIEQTVAAILNSALMAGEEKLDAQLCYQSRVGPLAWIGPAVEEEIRRAGAEGKGLIVQPTAFVSEHSETLVELDLEYAHVAATCGVADYIRVPTVSTHPDFIAALAELVRSALKTTPVNNRGTRICPPGKQCGFDACGETGSETSGRN